MYKGKPIKITADFSMETLKARRAWSEVFWALNENNFKPRILYSAKLSLKIRWSNKSLPQKAETKTIYDHQATTTKFSKEFGKQNHEKMGSIKPQKKRQGVRE
jgi:hypothetical protein